MIKKLKKKKNKFKIIQEKHTISTIVLILMFLVMTLTFSQNITLKIKNNKLITNIEEYQVLQEEIKSLTEIKENYEIITNKNTKLKKEKTKIENRITELNKKIKDLQNKIDKLK